MTNFLCLVSTPENEHPRGAQPCGRQRATPWMREGEPVGHPPNSRAVLQTCEYLWKRRSAGNMAHAGKMHLHPQSTAPITTTAFHSFFLITTESESM